MPYHLQNNAFLLTINPEKSSWDVVSSHANRVELKNIHMSLHSRIGSEQVWALEQWQSLQVGNAETVNSSQGRARQITLHIGPDRHQLEYQLLFALPEQEPSLMWKVRIHNKSNKPVKIEQIELLNLGFINISHGMHGFSHSQSLIRSGSSFKGSIKFVGSVHQTTSRLNNYTFFSNGWQSWSYTGTYTPKDRYKTTRLGPLRRPMIENPSTSRPKQRRLFRSDMFGVLCDQRQRTGILAGFLSQRNHFGALEAFLDPFNPALRMWASGDGAVLKPGDEMETDWACLYFLQLDAPDPLGPYLTAVAREHALPSMKDAVSPSGWCSWYYFSGSDYTGTVTPEAIRQNTLAVSSLRPELPLDLIQIDDGFESNVGDWFTFKPDFPQGVSPLADEIRQSGLTPGLWLAPFIVYPKSDLYRMHPEWILRNRLGKPVNAGFCWNAFTTALDLTHPEALDYIKQVVHRAVHNWGYEYLKLDFLYAASLPGKFNDPHKTRAQVLRSALEAVRLAAGPQARLLGCGCPLGPAIGLVDSMRIGTDTARTWVPHFKGTQTYIQQDVSMPSVRNSLHNALTRAPLHKRWWINDPDCLLVRPDSQLTLEEIHTVASVIALTGGSLFLSDDLPQLPAERLRIAQVLLPLIDKRPYILDWSEASTSSLLQLDLTNASGSWSLLGIFNWQDQPLEKILHLNRTYLDPEKNYLAREFWSGRVYQITDGQLVMDQLPAHACALLSVRTLNPHHPQYVGSDLHVSQGLEISEWKIADSELTFRIERPGMSHGMVAIYLPTPPQQAMCGSKQINIRLLTQNVYRLELDVDNSAFITIR